jgi:hypothetical protein
MSLGEGAAFLILERADTAKARGAPVLAVFGGAGNTCDAHHTTAPDPEGRGAESAMREALARAGIEPGDLHYVNAHGTGTKGNDVAEGQALRRVLGEESRIPVASSKPIFGHTLGASGAIEAVVSVLALDRAFFPGMRCLQPDPFCAVVPMTRTLPGTPKSVLSNSFGFGGNNTSLCFLHRTDPRGDAAAGETTLLRVSSYALAGATVDVEGRRAELPPLGPHRRHARLPRLAVALAKTSLGDGPVAGETSVFLGTALGSLTETEVFIETMIRENESTPRPRAFSASVHNASASRIAIAIKARGENQTFVHGELSFVQAAFAAARRRGPGPALFGACDELTDYVNRGRRACSAPPAHPAAEGGAILVADDSKPTLATVRVAAFGPAPDPKAWLQDHDLTGAVLVPTAALAELIPDAVLTPPFTGEHPARAASATALAVAVLAGELAPSALDLPEGLTTITVVSASRFRELGLLVVSKP